MASLLEKVSTLISANLHAMVDQALQSNSLAVIDQYVRQVEDNLEDLGGFFELFNKVDISVLQVRLIQKLGDTAYSNFKLEDQKNKIEQILSKLAKECKKRNTTFLKPNTNQLLKNNTINDASLIYQATCRYISPKVFWEKEFDWKNENYYDYCKKTHSR